MQTFLAQAQTTHQDFTRSSSDVAEYPTEAVFDELLHYTADEYLLRERNALNKHEFHAGKVIAMSGASIRHNRLAANIHYVLQRSFRAADAPLEVFQSDYRVHNPLTMRYVYPDVIVCDSINIQLAEGEPDILLNPLVIIEVLSKNTQHYDRNEKFDVYKSIESVQEYVLVSQASPHIEVFTRKNRLEWLYREQFDMDSVIELLSIHVPLPLREVYAKVEFGSEA